VKRANWLSAVLVAVILSPPGAESRTDPCAGPNSGQFDFWIGSWEVHAGGKPVGRNTITVILDGCTLLEEYHALDSNYAGRSFNYFDPSDQLWHQVWVDNSGVRLHLEGGWTGSGMQLEGERAVEGLPLRDRITWTANPDGTVRQLWEQSKDEGATWQAVFDGLYVPTEP